MRFNEFERDALISYGKKQGYITEGMSDEQIDEILPAVAAAGRMAAKGVGAVAKGAGKLAVKGAKAAAPHIKKAAVATGKAAGQQIAKGAKAVGQQVAKGAKAVGGAVAGAVADKMAQGQAPAQEVPPGADMTPSPTGQPQHNVPAGATDTAKHQGHGHQTDPKDQSKIAQRATALKGISGGKASGGQVAKGLDKVSAGSTMSPQLIKAVAPYTKKLQVIMNDPQLFTKFKMLMKQADASQQKAHA